MTCYYVHVWARDCDGVLERNSHRDGDMYKAWQADVRLSTDFPDEEFPVTYGRHGVSLWVSQPNDEGGGRTITYTPCEGGHAPDDVPKDSQRDHFAEAMGY